MFRYPSPTMLTLGTQLTAARDFRGRDGGPERGIATGPYGGGGFRQD